MSDDYPGTRSGRDVVYDYAERVGHLRPEEPPEDSDEWPDPREVTREGVMARLGTVKRFRTGADGEGAHGDTPDAERPLEGVLGVSGFIPGSETTIQLKRLGPCVRCGAPLIDAGHGMEHLIVKDDARHPRRVAVVLKCKGELR